MGKAHDRGQLDWLVELAGAAVPALAAAYAAVSIAPGYGWPIASAVLVAFGSVFVVAFATMRATPAETLRHALPEFEISSIDDVLPGEELLLDQLYLDELLLDQPLVEAETEAVAELLLDDPLPVAAHDSRVVQLFAGGRAPTAGQLKDRIDRHLAEGGKLARPPGRDASDALSEALAELRRSLRQA